MDEEKKLYLMMGCWGRIENNGFVMCKSACNRILEVTPELSEDYEDIIEYFRSCRLFERKVMDYNAVRNVLFRMQDKFNRGYKRLWDEKYFRMLELFSINHKNCGIYLDLELLVPENKKEERIVVIEPTL